jgi:Chain length determinant protein
MRPDHSSDEISVKAIVKEIAEVINYLISKWIILCIIIFIGLGLGYLYANNKNPIYTASTTFVLEEGENGGSSLGKYAGLASMVGVDVGSGGGIFQGDNIIQLYKSRTMIEKTLFSEIEVDEKSELLIDRYIAFNKLNETWKNKEELKNFKFNVNLTSKNRLQDSLLNIIFSDISNNYLSVTKPDKLLSIIKAEVSGPDEVFVKLFNDLIVKNVNDFYIQTKTKKSLQNIKILQQKTDSVRAVMNGAIYSAAVAIDQTPNLNPTRQAQRTAPVQRSQFKAEANKEIFSELMKNLELSKLALLKETPLIQVIDGPVYPLEKEKLSLFKTSAIGGGLAFFIASLCLLILRFLKKIN